MMTAFELTTIDSPIYVLQGNDSFMQNLAISNLKKLVASLDLNVNYYEDVKNYNEVVMALNTLSFFNEKQLVIVRQSSQLSKDDEAILLSYAKAPNPQSCLVLVDGSSVFKNIAKLSCVVSCTALKGDQLKEWTANLLSGFKVSSDAILTIIDYCNGDMMTIKNECEKLFAYVDGKEITLDVVKECTPANTDYQVFELTNSISRGDGDNALKVLESLLKRGEEPIVLFSIMNNYFRRMLHFSLSSQTNDELAKQFGIKPQAVDINRKNAKKYTIKKLKSIVDIFNNLEFAFKSGKMLPLQALHQSLAEILSKVGG